MNTINPNEQSTDNALSVYGQSDALDDFPVLKAFQQYIDAEQAKSRKRLVSLCIFFGVLMFVVVSFFVAILFYTSAKKNELYDRLIECAMQDRSTQQREAAVVAQPAQDSAAILSLTSKLEEMQRRLAAAEQEKSRRAAAESAATTGKDAATPKPLSAEEVEIKRLTALLELEKEKRAAEKKRLREAELDAYRRKYYPEIYERKRTPVKERPVVKQDQPEIDEPETADEEDGAVDGDEDIDSLLDSLKNVKPMDAEPDKKSGSGKKAPKEKSYSIPVDVKGSSSSWLIPDED